MGINGITWDYMGVNGTTVRNPTVRCKTQPALRAELTAIYATLTRVKRALSLRGVTQWLIIREGGNAFCFGVGR